MAAETLATQPQPPPAGPQAQPPQDNDKDSGRKCENCLRPQKGVHYTQRCMCPSKNGDVAVDPFHFIGPYSHVYRQYKGPNWRDHTLDGPPGPDNLADCGRMRFATLQTRVDILVKRRIHLPPFRVTKPTNCFVWIVLADSRLNYGGQLPPYVADGWPLLKTDSQVPDTVRALRRYEQLLPAELPKSSLNSMTFADIRRDYNLGIIPRQIHSEDDPVAPRVSTNSDDGGDYILEDDHEMADAGPAEKDTGDDSDSAAGQSNGSEYRDHESTKTKKTGDSGDESEDSSSESDSAKSNAVSVSSAQPGCEVGCPGIIFKQKTGRESSGAATSAPSKLSGKKLDAAMDEILIKQPEQDPAGAAADQIRIMNFSEDYTTDIDAESSDENDENNEDK